MVSIWQINQVFNGLLLSGSADGSVRVWRDYTFPRTQRLATAWQVTHLLLHEIDAGIRGKDIPVVEHLIDGIITEFAHVCYKIGIIDCPFFVNARILVLTTCLASCR